MVTAGNSAVGCDGSAGVGGKIRKRLFRRSQTTPYDRPATALRPTQAAVLVEGNGWLSKLVDPASKLIAAGAHKLFSSVFRKRLLPPPPLPQHPPDETKDIGDLQKEAATMVVPSATNEPVVCGVNSPSRISDSNGFAELEDILKQKTFTRSEIDHLTELLLSRTVDNLIEAHGGRSEPNFSDPQAVHGRHEKLYDLPAHENRADCVVRAAISTPDVRSKAPEDVVTSPAEIAKAYMGSKPTGLSPSRLSLQNQIPSEDVSAPYNPPFKPKSPAISLIQKPVGGFRTPANGLMTPRFRGRSAIYSMARTPCSTPHPTAAFKAGETSFNIHGGSSSSYSATVDHQLTGSKRQVLKRRSSVLEKDIESVGSIRRIRQKPNLLHHKTLTLPASGGSHAAHGSGALSAVTEVPSSLDVSSDSRSLVKALPDNSLPSTSSGYVPSQSIEMAQKIFQQLDKLTPKAKSTEKKIDITAQNSPTKRTPDMLKGLAHKSMETVDSLKVLQNIRDIRKENASLDSINAHDLSSKISPRVEDASIKESVIPSDKDGAEARSSTLRSSYNSMATDYANPCSNFDHLQKKQAFQMSAHEDYLEVDDDMHAYGIASTTLTEGLESGELYKNSAAIFDSLPRNEATSKPPAPEQKPSPNLFLSKKEVESLSDGSVAVEKATGFYRGVPSSSSATSMSMQTSVTAPQSSPEIGKGASLSEKNDDFGSFSFKDKQPPIPFSRASSIVEFAVPKDTKQELRSSANDTAAKANDGPDKTDDKRTQVIGKETKKTEDAPSVMSAAKGVFYFQLPTNTAAPNNRLPCTAPSTCGVLSPFQFSSRSNNQSPVPVSVSSPLPFSLSNGSAEPTSLSASATAGTMTATATTNDRMTTFSASNSHLLSSVTAPSVLSGSSFQFGSPAVPSASATLTTPAPDSAANAEAKSNETDFGSATSSLLSFKSPGTASGGSDISGFNVSTFKTADSETQAASPVTSSGFVSGIQALLSGSSVPTSKTSLPGQFTTSVLTPVCGLTGPASFTSGASVFGSSSASANPFTLRMVSASSALGSSSVSAPVSSSSNTQSSMFGSTWPSAKPTFPGSTFGTTSPTTGFSFGLTASGSSAGDNSTPIVFGSTTSASAASNTTPFVFGSGQSAAPIFSIPSAAVSTSASSSTSFPSQPAFGNSSPQAFVFGSTPSRSNDQMSMEDTMAEDSVHVSAPETPVFGAPTLVSSSGFVFGGATSSIGSSFQFGSKQNPMVPQCTSPFQASGNLEFNAGGAAGSFSLGSGGGDKSNRRIVKVKRKK